MQHFTNHIHKSPSDLYTQYITLPWKLTSALPSTYQPGDISNFIKSALTPSDRVYVRSFSKAGLQIRGWLNLCVYSGSRGISSLIPSICSGCVVIESVAWSLRGEKNLAFGTLCLSKGWWRRWTRDELFGSNPYENPPPPANGWREPD